MEPTFWFMNNWAVRTARFNEAADDTYSRPTTSRFTQARQVSTGKPKTVPQQGGRESGGGGGGSVHIFKPPQGSTIKNQSLTLQDGVEHAADIIILQKMTMLRNLKGKPRPD
jgi:hypothetical protein